MRINICGIQNEQDLAAAIASDADAVGFLVGQVHQSDSFILPSTAGRLAAQIPPYVSSVIVTHLTDASEIIEILDKSGIFNVQLHGAYSFEEVEKLRDMMPDNGQIILSEYVKDENFIADKQEFYPLADALLLDCYNQSPGLVGRPDPSKRYFWDQCADFVRECPIPVILAGGLNTVNIAEALEKLNPYGVDVFSCVRDFEKSALNAEKCREFVMQAKRASFDLKHPSLI